MTNEQMISFTSTDELLGKLKEVNAEAGMAGVVDWVDETFQPNTRMSIARDITNLDNVDDVVIQDRSIIQLDESGSETGNFYLAPRRTNATEEDFFLSVSPVLGVDEPYMLLIYATPVEP